MANYSKRIIYLTEAQRKELFLNETITVNGTTINYDPNDIYVTPQELNMTIGQITTLPAAAEADASITGSLEDMTLNLGLPRGKSGVYIGAEPPTDQDISVWIDTSDSSNPYVETLTGTDVTIVGSPNCRYMCGELYSLAITPPTAGTMDVMFTSGSTPTVLTVPSTVKFPEWCDPANLEANMIYEIYIMDGSFAGVSTWPV